MKFDLIVIGSGPGGQRAAVQGAKAGKKVAVIEEYPQVGGGCVHWGTLPSKSFRESVYRWSLGSRGTLGRTMEYTHAPAEPHLQSELPDIHRLLKRRDRVVTEESEVILNQLKRNKITILHGRARFMSSTQIEVSNSQGSQVIEAPYTVIASGARPVPPKHLQVDGKMVCDSNSILGMKKLPRTMVVLGAGVIGCEYASMFAIAGTHVILVDKRNEILASVDREIANHLVERFEYQGLEIVLEAEATKVEALEKPTDAGSMCVYLNQDRKIICDVVLVALGRRGNTEDLGLEKAGIKADDRGLIKVNQVYQTEVPNIYAVGDVVGAPALASTSMEQGRVACCHAFKIEEAVLSPYYPFGIYTIPEISMVGPTEEDMIAKKQDYVIGRARYKELARGQIVGDQWGLLKLVVDKKTLKLLGVHIIGDNAADLVHIGQAVMTFGGDVKYFIQTVFNYPTLAEAYKTAAFHAVNQLKGTTQSK